MIQGQLGRIMAAFIAVLVVGTLVALGFYTGVLSIDTAQLGELARKPPDSDASVEQHDPAQEDLSREPDAPASLTLSDLDIEGGQGGRTLPGPPVEPDEPAEIPPDVVSPTDPEVKVRRDRMMKDTHICADCVTLAEGKELVPCEIEREGDHEVHVGLEWGGHKTIPFRDIFEIHRATERERERERARVLVEVTREAEWIVSNERKSASMVERGYTHMPGLGWVKQDEIEKRLEEQRRIRENELQEQQAEQLEAGRRQRHMFMNMLSDVSSIRSTNMWKVTKMLGHPDRIYSRPPFVVWRYNRIDGYSSDYVFFYFNSLGVIAQITEGVFETIKVRDPGYF